MSEADRAEKNGLRALKTVRRALTEVGWDPQETDYEGVLRVDFSVDNIPISEALADVRIEYERFLYYLVFRDRADRRTRRELMEFVTRANSDLVIGNFELNLDTGVLRFKASVDFTNVPLTAVLIRNMIRCSMDAVEHFADAAVSVLRGDKRTKEALENIEDQSGTGKNERSDGVAER